jgi:hypothetical protein
MKSSARPKNGACASDAHSIDYKHFLRMMRVEHERDNDDGTMERVVPKRESKVSGEY